MLKEYEAVKGSAPSLLNLNNNKTKAASLIDALKRIKLGYRLYFLMEKRNIKKDTYCPICHHRTYFTRKVVDILRICENALRGVIRKLKVGITRLWGCRDLNLE